MCELFFCLGLRLNESSPRSFMDGSRNDLFLVTFPLPWERLLLLVIEEIFSDQTFYFFINKLS